MTTPLITLPLRQKRDLLRARQITRQAADLLGYSAADQTCLAAAAFHLACDAHAATGHASICFELSEECLRITCTPTPKPKARKPAPMQLSKHLPATSPLQREDVPWMLHQLAELAPVDVFEEMRRVNQELLRALLDLAACKAGQRQTPSAA
jgi:hypothetical protein